MTSPFSMRQAADGSFEVLISLPGLERWCGCASRADAERVRALWLGHRAAAEAFERSAYPMVASMLRRQTETLERLLAACG